MSLNKIHNRLTLAATVTALVCLGVASGSSVFITLVAIGVVVGFLFFERPIFSARFSDWLGFGGGFGCAAVAYANSETLLDVATYFLLIVQLFKLPAKKRELDFRLLYAFGVLDIGVAAAMTFDLSFGVLFLTYTFFSIWALSVHSVWLSAPPKQRDEPVRGILRSVLFATTFSIAISSVVFVFFPRISARFISQLAQPTYVTGVSDVVDLTNLGHISPDEEEVMRVQIEDGSHISESALYIRGACLVHYRDGVWRRADPEREETLYEMGKTTIGALPVWGVRDEEDAQRLNERYCRKWRKRVKLKVWLKPLIVEGSGNQFIYVMSEPMWILFKGRYLPFRIYTSPSGTIIWDRKQQEMAYYEVYCAFLKRGQILEGCRSPRFFHGVDYLQLPAESPSLPLSEIRELAETVCRRARASTPFQMAYAIEQWLSQNLRYTYSPTRRDRFLDPTYEFLFKTKEGHCELFASAMALMLRCLGVACRVVTGFRGGVYNRVGGFYVVRRENAHAWVEVLLDDDANPHNFNPVRWVTFDPTPPYRPPERGIFDWVSDFIAYLRHRWLTHIVLYGSRQQRTLLKMIGATGRRAVSSVKRVLRDFFSVVWSALKAIFPLLIIAAAAVTSILLLRVKVRRRSPPHASEPAVWFYRTLLKAAAKRGLVRRPSQTPFELVTPLLFVFGRDVRKEIEFLTRTFVEVRYGGRHYKDDALLRKALKRVLNGKGCR